MRCSNGCGFAETFAEEALAHSGTRSSRFALSFVGLVVRQALCGLWRVCLATSAPKITRVLRGGLTARATLPGAQDQNKSGYVAGGDAAVQKGATLPTIPTRGNFAQTQTPLPGATLKLSKHSVQRQLWSEMFVLIGANSDLGARTTRHGRYGATSF